MKDPRLGTFGALGLILVVIFKISVLIAMPTYFVLLALPLAASTARWLLLWAARQPTARPGGLGAAFRPELGWMGWIISAVVPLGLAVLCGWRGFAALVIGCFCATGIIRLARIRLGGLTGDVFGLIVESVEAVILLVVVAHI